MSDKDDLPKKLPSPSDILKSEGFNESDSDIRQETVLQRAEQAAIEAEANWIRLTGLNDHYKQKSRWSRFLMFILFGMITFQSYLLYQVGMGAWDFSKYDWLLQALLVQNLGQIVALAYVVVKSLFR